MKWLKGGFYSLRLIPLGFVLGLWVSNVGFAMLSARRLDEPVVTYLLESNKSSLLVDNSKSANLWQSVSKVLNDKMSKNLARKPLAGSELDASLSVLSNHESGVKWPQKDDRIAKAVQNGSRIDVPINVYSDPKTNVSYYDCERYTNETMKCEAPPKGLATVVTAYYYMRSKHSHQMYRDWMDLMLTSTDPMVVFVEPDLFWPQFVSERRKHAPTIVVSMPFKDFTMATTFSNDFWENSVGPTDKNGLLKSVGVDVYKMWNEKYILMNEVANLNPFNTQHIFWVDSGYYRRKVIAPNYAPIIRNNITKNGIGPDQMAFQNIFRDPAEYEIAAGAWGGTVEAVTSSYERYFETFWWMVMNGYDCVGYEQRVMLLMCKSFPGLCNIHTDKWDKRWFEMGRTWLRDPNFDFSQSFKLLHNETGFVQKVPFPTERVIHANMTEALKSSV